MRKFWLIFSIIFVILAVFSNDCGVSAEPLTALEIRTVTNAAIKDNNEFLTYMNEHHNPLLIHVNNLCKEIRPDVRIADELWQYYSENPEMKEKIQENQINNLESAEIGLKPSAAIRDVLKFLAKRDNCLDAEMGYDRDFIHFKLLGPYDENDPFRKQLRGDTEHAYYHPKSFVKYHQILSRPPHRDHVLLHIECSEYFTAQNDDERRESLERMKVILFRPFLWYEVRIYMWSFANGPDGNIDGEAVGYLHYYAQTHLELVLAVLLIEGEDYA